jgi:hypothetical protein
MNAQQIIDKAKAYAEANYDKGMDIFVECFGGAEWNDFIHYSEFEGKSGLMPWNEVKKEMDEYRDLKAEQKSEVCGW